VKQIILWSIYSYGSNYIKYHDSVMVKMWCAYTIENKINHKKNEKQNQSMRLRTHY